MPSRKTIKRRIASVTTTKQIVKAMNMVAATKLQKTKRQFAAARPLFKASVRIMDAVSNCELAGESVFFQQRPVKTTAYVVITGNRGYCGGYNSNVSALALAHMDEGRNEEILAIGTRGRDYFQRLEKNIRHCYAQLSEHTTYAEAQGVAEALLSLYVSGEVDEVYVAHTQFQSVLSHEPTLTRILPMGDGEDPKNKPDRLQYEPDAEAFLEVAVPAHISAFLYGAVLESGCCEQAARMVSMDGATKNATEIIENLTRVYNRTRQAHITQEITEIIASVNISK
ncbi:MAG: ATP synthase F1 subunit gamma [Oscillospiraceae bacterium]|nr:ATP synthase F1 subunit gamma [Oscillospiraceae bacterium]